MATSIVFQESPLGPRSELIERMISERVAAEQAASDAANLVLSSYLPTMASMATFEKPEEIGAVTILGMHTPFDGLGGQWAFDASDTSSPVNAPFVLHDAKGGRWKWVTRSQHLTARHFGAVNDGVSDDTAALANVPAGADVDLGGRACKVSAVPQKWRGYNGAFIVGSARYDCPPRPMGPFDGFTATKAMVLTWWPAGMVYLPDSDELVTFVVQSGRHDTVGGSWVQAIRSKDHGVTDFHSHTIFSDLTHNRVRAAAIGSMGNGRVGGIVTTGPNGGLTQWFIWNDTATLEPSAWHRVQLTGITASVQAYGQIMPGPDETGEDWMMPCYYPACVLRTQDNGTNWEVIELLDETGLPEGAYSAEQAIIRVPDRGWVILSRIEGGTPPHNAYISVGTDLLSMPAWKNSGIDMGSQAIHGLYDGDRIQLLFTDRDGFPGQNPDNTARIIEVSASQIFDAPTSLGRLPHRQINGPHRLTGYAMSIRLAQSADHFNAPWLTVFKGAEGASTIRGSDSQMIFLSQNEMVMPSPEPSRMELANCNHGFGLMRRPSSVLAASTADRGGPDRWRLLNGSSDLVTIAATRTALSDTERDFMPWLTHKLSLETSEANTFSGIGVRWHGAEAIEKEGALSMRQITVRATGIGPVPKLAPAVTVRYGDPVAPTATSLPISPGLYLPEVPESVTGPWMIEQVFELGESPCLPMEVFTTEFVLTTGATAQQWVSAGSLTSVTLWTGANVSGDRYRQSFQPDHRYLWGDVGRSNARILSGQAANDGTAEFDFDGLLSDHRNFLTLHATNFTGFSIRANSNLGGDKPVIEAPTLLREDDWNGRAILQVRAAAASFVTGQHVRLKAVDDDALILVDTGA